MNKQKHQNSLVGSLLAISFVGIGTFGCSTESSLEDVEVVQASLNGPVDRSGETDTLKVDATATLADADGVAYLRVELPVEVASYFGGARITLALVGFENLVPGTYAASDEATGDSDTLPDGTSVSLVAESGKIFDEADPKFEFVWASIVDDLVVTYADNGEVQLKVNEQLWPTLTEASTLIEVRLSGFPELPSQSADEATGSAP